MLIHAKDLYKFCNSFNKLISCCLPFCANSKKTALPIAFPFFVVLSSGKCTYTLVQYHQKVRSKRIY